MIDDDCAVSDDGLGVFERAGEDGEVFERIAVDDDKVG